MSLAQTLPSAGDMSPGVTYVCPHQLLSPNKSISEVTPYRSVKSVWILRSLCQGRIVCLRKLSRSASFHQTRSVGIHLGRQPSDGSHSE